MSASTMTSFTRKPLYHDRKALYHDATTSKRSASARSRARWVDSQQRLYSIDAVPHWAETTWATMPAHLQTLTTVTSSEIAGVTIGDYHVLRHRPIPDVVPDFVYVDGPDFQEFTHLADFPAACDVLDLEPPVVSQRAEGPPTRRVMVCRGNRGIGTSRLDDEIRGDSGAEAKEG